MSASDPHQAAIQWEEARRWFDRADDDLVMARLALDRAPPIIGQAAFHCQQAAEKLLKGLLIAASLTAPKTHDLGRLAPGVAAAFPDIGPAVLDLQPLTSWYVAGRYPDVETPEPEADAIETALAALHDLRRAVVTLDPSQP